MLIITLSIAEEDDYLLKYKGYPFYAIEGFDIYILILHDYWSRKDGDVNG